MELLSELKKIQSDLSNVINTVESSQLNKSPKPAIINKKKDNGITVYLNAGHGGIDPATGKYMTFASDGKFYEFTDKKGRVIDVAYEGQMNREYADTLKPMLEAAGFRVVIMHHPVLDRTNFDRAAIANADWQKLNDKRKSIWIGLHFNAFGMSSRGLSVPARGASIWTLNGQNQSDVIAQDVWTHFKNKTQKFGINYREDLSDKDGDFEARFYEFTLTRMFAFILETLFFTNIDDVLIARNDAFRIATCEGIRDGLLEAFGVNV